MFSASPQSLAQMSRFYQRWLAADPARAGRVDTLSALSLASLDFGAALATEAASGPNGTVLPTTRAMCRLRNLLNQDRTAPAFHVADAKPIFGHVADAGKCVAWLRIQQ